MKKKHTIVAAALAAVLLCTTALAATSSTLLSKLFYTVNAKEVVPDPRAEGMIQDIGGVYETDVLRIFMQEGLYSRADRVLGVSLSMASKTPGETYFIFTDAFELNGGNVGFQNMSMFNFTEMMLQDEPVESAMRAELSEELELSENIELSISYHVLRLRGTVLDREVYKKLLELSEEQGYEAFRNEVSRLTGEGYVVLAADGYIETGREKEGESYVDMLLGTGNFERCDDVRVIVALSDKAAPTVYRVAGEANFAFDGAELAFENVECGKLTARIQARVLVDDMAEFGDYYCLKFANDGWFTSFNFDTTDFVKRDDGRYESVWVGRFELAGEMPDKLTAQVCSFNPDTFKVEPRAGMQAEAAIEKVQ